MNLNIEAIGREALTYIKAKYEIPKSGLLAGGSLANVMWEIVSGNKAVINDIDIFNLIECVNKKNVLSRNYYYYHKPGEAYQDNYNGIRYVNRYYDKYSIEYSKRDGIINDVGYISNTENPTIVIESFDINATMVGYLIEEDKFFWTKEFKDFLKTGSLKLVNVSTPAHSAIRLLKKKQELNCYLDELELKICQFVLTKKKEYTDIIRYRFKEKNKKLFDKNSEILSKYFSLNLDIDLMNQLKEYDEIIDVENIYTLDVHESYTHNFGENIDEYIHSSKDFLFYVRNILGDTYKESLYSKLIKFCSVEDYIEENVNYDYNYVNLLHRLVKELPSCAHNLSGYKLIDQINLVKKIFNLFKDDLKFAIYLLSSYPLKKDIDFDSDFLLILKIMARKQLNKINQNKIDRILYPHKEKIKKIKTKLIYSSII